MTLLTRPLVTLWVAFMVVITSSVTEALKYDACTKGFCVPLTECPFFLHIMEARPPGYSKALRDAICGFNGKTAKVCCGNFEVINSDAEVFDELSVRAEGVFPTTAPTTTTSTPSTTHPTPPPRRRRPHRFSMRGERPSSTTVTPLPRHTTAGTRNWTGRYLPSSLRDQMFPPTCGRATITGRIYGGERTSYGSYPWMASLTYENRGLNMTQVRCAGTLINSKFVVTAAHCLDPVETKNWTLVSVQIGAWDLSLAETRCPRNGPCGSNLFSRTIQRSFIHPEYNAGFRLDNDVALLKLSSRVYFNNNIKPLCLPPAEISYGEAGVGRTVTVTGWGMTEHDVASTYLRAVTLKISHPGLCKKVYPDNFNINGRQICIGGEGIRDTCQGDSGSPVTKLGKQGQYYLLGVTSYGSKVCGRKGYPAVYTSVAHYMDWIRDTVSQHFFGGGNRRRWTSA